MNPPTHYRKTNMTKPTVLIGCLRSYNEGHHYDVEIEFDNPETTLAHLTYEVATLLQGSSDRTGRAAEEFHVADFSGFGGFEIDRYESLSSIAHMARLVLSFENAEILEAACHAFEPGYTAEMMKKNPDWVRERFICELPDDGNYMQQEHERDLPSKFRFYMDWKEMEEEDEINGGHYKARINHTNFYFRNI